MNNKKLKTVLIILVLLIALPVGRYYFIGPRDISDSAEMKNQRIDYMGHEYHIVGWHMGPKVNVNKKYI